MLLRRDDVHGVHRKRNLRALQPIHSDELSCATSAEVDLGFDSIARPAPGQFCSVYEMPR
jgi:hypothetical protein